MPEDFQDVINAANSSTSASTMMQSDPVLAPWQEATRRFLNEFRTGET